MSTHYQTRDSEKQIHVPCTPRVLKLRVDVNVPLIYVYMCAFLTAWRGCANQGSSVVNTTVRTRLFISCGYCRLLQVCLWKTRHHMKRLILLSRKRK